MKTKKEKGIVVAKVASDSNPRKMYDIRKIGVGMFTCSCMSYRFSEGRMGEKAPCKHLLQVVA